MAECFDSLFSQVFLMDLSRISQGRLKDKCEQSKLTTVTSAAHWLVHETYPFPIQPKNSLNVAKGMFLCLAGLHNECSPSVHSAHSFFVSGIEESVFYCTFESPAFVISKDITNANSKMYNVCTCTT
jgi:hypothetical protein